MRDPHRPALLHFHGDGSKYLLPILPELFRLSKKPFPFNEDAYAPEVKKLFADPQVDIVRKFSNTTGVMQTPETLELAGHALTTGLARDGYRYAEITIAPQYHMFEGLSAEEVVGALISGIKRGEEEFEEMEANLLFTIGREVSPQDAVALVEAAGRCNRDYVVGIGLVCDENFHPPLKHWPMTQRAKDLNFPLAYHAGEWASSKNVMHMKRNETDTEKILRAEREKYRLLQNIAVAAAIFNVDRIGHAIPLAYSPELIDYIVGNNIGIEWCPGSNLISGLIPNVEFLKIPELLEQGVMGCINPDDDLFLPDMDETVALCDFSQGTLEELEAHSWSLRFGKRKYI